MLGKCLALISLTFIPVILEYYSSKCRKEITNYTSCCLFVTPANIECRQHIFKNISCGNRCSNTYILKIVEFIESAKHSISLCMYLLTLRQIGEALCEAHKKGVIVRYITDAEMAGATGAKVKQLKECVKTQERDGSLMHHKFCLIDEHTPYGRVMTGTLNLTLQGITNNWENLVFFNQPQLVKSFSKAFEEMWENFRDAQ